MLLIGFMWFNTISVWAQRSFSGRIFDAESDSTLSGVSVFNVNSKAIVKSDTAGRYQISASEGDKIQFSSVGYNVENITVEFYFFNSGYDVGLTARFNTLETVLVNQRNYSADSLERREEYRRILENPRPGITGGNTPQHGFGIVLSPFSFFSKPAREERALRKKLVYEEEMEYVDFRFSRELVAHYTGLKGDSLQTFLLKFRPSYEFCRASSQQDMINYINQKMKIYMRREENK